MRNGSDDRFFIGMLSGTSRDGVDTVLVHFSNNLPKVIAAHCVAYPAPLQETLRKMIDRRIRPAEEEMAVVTEDLAEVFALSVWALLDQAGVKPKDVVAIGSHGQTVWHRPTGKNPESIQLGKPQLIANLTGIPTVGNFRQADIAAGGQGAPLAPLLHGALLMPAKGVRAVLNIGGISNISVLAANGPSTNLISGYDTGPGNCLLDAWVKKHEGSDFDDGGQWAAGGTVDESLLELLLADPYFALPPPKSTGVEYFNIYWLKKCMDEHASLPAGGDKGASDRPGGPPHARDVQATLSELTAHSVATAVRRSGANELLVCGGGVHNVDLLKRLQRLLPDTRVGRTNDSGIDPDLVEAILFAWLARERIANRALDTRRITGAREPVLLGEIFDPA